ncbi:glycosyl hydrolase family 3 N terminal domain-containing protein [Gongronella butleri]|nr:glycosyl hydrolase family 3 N terminal domain-containing protein [Gongronella butleri]
MFPAGVTAAATFDSDAMHQRGIAMGQEFRGKGAHIQLGPGMNFMRAPGGGRGWESFGEEPYLMGEAAVQTITGIQSQQVIATAKHYVMNDQETNRHSASSDADERTLREIYVYPFERAIEAGVGSVMCSYNPVNGTHACENPQLLGILRDDLQFQGFITSDWWATLSTAPSANAGMDMSMPGNDFGQNDPHSGSWYGQNLTWAVQNDTVSKDRLTDMATRIAAAHFKMRQDEDFPDTTLHSFNLTGPAGSVDVKADHVKLVRSIAAAGTVLLTNDGILPLSSDNKSIAIIGQDAFMDDLLLNPDNSGTCSDFGCDPGTLFEGWGSGTVSFPYPLIAPYDGLVARAGDGVNFTTAKDNYDSDAIKQAAMGSDIAIVFVNSDSGEEYITVDGNVGDRNNLTIWQNGDQVVQTVAENNNNTIVVVHSVGAVLMPWIDHPNIRAVVWPNVPGEQSGNALADIVYGDVNPSGRLPYTIAKKEDDYPASVSKADNITYSEKLLIGYRWFDAHNIEPLFPFGHGLSYTTFNYSKLQVHAQGKKDEVKVTVTVTNTGNVDGSEIAQLYLSFPESAGEPPKVLRGFEKVMIHAGKSEHVTFSLGTVELSIFDVVSHGWVVPTGDYQVHVGASSRDLRASASFTL